MPLFIDTLIFIARFDATLVLPLPMILMLTFFSLMSLIIDFDFFFLRFDIFLSFD